VKPTEVEPDEVTQAAQGIERNAEEMGEGLKALEATVTSGNPWGQDEQGSLFGLAYKEILEYAIDTYDSHVGLLMDAADNLKGWAQQLRDVDEQGAGMFRNLQGKLGG